VLNQLLYAGVLETVRIRKQGYPFRETYLEFMRRIVDGKLSCLVSPAIAAKLPRPPAAKFVQGADGKAVDASATPEVMKACRAGCVAFLTVALPLDGSLAPDEVKMARSRKVVAASALRAVREAAAAAEKRAKELHKEAAAPVSMAKGGAAARANTVKAAAAAEKLAAQLAATLKHKEAEAALEAAAQASAGAGASADPSTPKMPQWTTGRNKIFMKDGALQAIVRRFRAHHALILQAWWRMARQRRLFLRVRHRFISLQRGVRRLLKLRRYQRAEKVFLKMQTHFRRRRAQAFVKQLRRTRAARVVAAHTLGWVRRRQYRRIVRAIRSSQLAFRFLRKMRRRKPAPPRAAPPPRAPPPKLTPALLGGRAHVNAKDAHSFTALMDASITGKEAWVEALLANGADANVSTVIGWTALMYACRNGHEAVARRLVKAGANVNAKSRVGNTPLNRAKEYGHVAIVNFLRSVGAKAE